MIIPIPKVRRLQTINLLFMLFVFLFSCRNNGEYENGKATVKVNLRDVENALIDGKIQKIIIPYDKKYSIIATLVPELPAKSRNILNREITELKPGTVYKVIAYDNDGNYVDQKNYKYGQEASATGFYLNAGESYTFVSYSVGDTSELQDVKPVKLNEVSLNINGKANFMHFMRIMKLNAGENNLDIVLKHKFSQITTKINAEEVGAVTAVTANIGPHHFDADIKLSDITIAYSESTGVSDISFPLLGENHVESLPTMVCSPATQTGILTIPSITIAGTTKTNIVVNDLKITPGVRYSLSLNITEEDKDGVDIGGEFVWAPGNLVYNDGIYEFTKDQSGFGDLWEANALLPKRIGGEGSIGQDDYDPAKDPCRLVATQEGKWRMPRRVELEKYTGTQEAPGVMFHLDYNIPPYPYRANYKGVEGIFIGTNKQPSTGDLNKFLFFPLAGGQSVGIDPNEGSYWTLTSTALDNNYRFNFNRGGISFYNGQYFTYGASIRCIKTK
ncbi:fimbrillin family protein [Elizabethkingia meningoseptica]|nr:fimbrillin family protein [Elizabethkingia meningoseptica]